MSDGNCRAPFRNRTPFRGDKGEGYTQDLLQSLRGDWLKLPLAVMRDVGPAVQTLAGFLIRDQAQAARHHFLRRAATFGPDSIRNR